MVVLERGLRICIYDQFPGDVMLLVGGPHLENHWSKPPVPAAWVTEPLGADFLKLSFTFSLSAITLSLSTVKEF